MADRDTQVPVLALDKDGSLYLRTAARQLEEGAPLSALTTLRNGKERFPEQRESFVIKEAEVLNRMQRFEDSIRLLLTLCPLEELPEDGVWGLIHNYLALEELPAAGNIIALYMQRFPKGAYIDQCRDYWAMLHDRNALSWQLGLDEGEDSALLVNIHLAKAMHFSHKDDMGKLILLEAQKDYPHSLWLQMELALCQFSLGETVECQQRLFNILKQDGGFERAWCLLSLIRLSEHKRREAREIMDRLPIPVEGDGETLGNMLAMFLELGDYTRAKECGELLLERYPYDDLFLHQSAYAYYMLCEPHKATACYDTILSIRPEDSVAIYYKEVIAKNPDPKQGGKLFTTHYDVSYGEAVLRFGVIGEYLKKGPEESREAFKKGGLFKQLLLWALHSPLGVNKAPVFHVLGAMDGPDCTEIMEDFLLRMDQSDADKQIALQILQERRRQGPLSFYYEGRWQYGVVQINSMPGPLPKAYRRVLDLLNQYQSIPPATTESAKTSHEIYLHYINKLDGVYPKLDVNQQKALATAIILMSMDVHRLPHDIEALCEEIGVSLRRVDNALNRLLDIIKPEERT